MKKINVYVDMDGTVAEWDGSVYIEDIVKEGYFRNRPAMKNSVEAIRKMALNEKFEVFILSAVFAYDHIKEDKKNWLKEHMPEISDDHILFVPCGTSKSDAITVKEDTDVLIDDFTQNLNSWHGKAIKIYNGINGTKGSWTGYSVHSSMNSECLQKQLEAICLI